MSLTRGEVNRKLAEFMGLCWHEPKIINFGAFSSDNEWECRRCGKASTGFSRTVVLTNPDYCSSDSPRRLLEEVVAKVVEKVGENKYFQVLALSHEGFANKFPLNSSAEQIARACYACNNVRQSRERCADDRSNAA